MYIQAIFNNKTYFICDAINQQMLLSLLKIYRVYCPGAIFTTINQNGNCYGNQREFIRDYKSANHLSQQIEHLPLDNT